MSKPEKFVKYPDDWSRTDLVDAIKESEELTARMVKDRDAWKESALEAMWRLERLEQLVRLSFEVVAREPKPLKPVFPA